MMNMRSNVRNNIKSFVTFVKVSEIMICLKQTKITKVVKVGTQGVGPAESSKTLSNRSSGLASANAAMVALPEDLHACAETHKRPNTAWNFWPLSHSKARSRQPAAP